MIEKLKLHNFLRKRDTFTIKVLPQNLGWIEVEGEVFFNRKKKGYPKIAGNFEINIKIPKTYPNDLPTVKEIGNKIPRDEKFHLNFKRDSKTNELYYHSCCLGSELRIRTLIAQDYSIENYVTEVVEPYLYSVLYKMETGKDFPIGELAHYNKGLVDDYIDLLGLKSEQQLIKALSALSEKKRISNKKPCPCNCGLKLGRCDYHLRLNKFRNLIPRYKYQKLRMELFGE